MNPITRLLAAVAGALVLAGMIFFGFFAMLAAVALGLVAWLVLWLRIWWFKRKLAASGRQPTGFGQPFSPGARQDEPPGDVIDAEYEVVSKEGEDDR